MSPDEGFDQLALLGVVFVVELDGAAHGGWSPEATDDQDFLFADVHHAGDFLKVRCSVCVGMVDLLDFPERRPVFCHPVHCFDLLRILRVDHVDFSQVVREVELPVQSSRDVGSDVAPAGHGILREGVGRERPELAGVHVVEPDFLPAVSEPATSRHRRWFCGRG